MWVFVSSVDTAVKFASVVMRIRAVVQRLLRVKVAKPNTELCPNSLNSSAN
jgi:hypothetical protein